MADEFSRSCKEVLRLLKTRRNVLIQGAPGTGKSRLLSEVARAFVTSPISTATTSTPVHVVNARVSIPQAVPVEVDTDLQNVWPAPDRRDRQVFPTVFHQNSKYRDFITGIMPVMGSGNSGFQVVTGTLYRASEHAKLSDGASLLIIDEINRGPAVQVFGGSIVAIEPEKRLLSDGMPGLKTQYFELLSPPNGELVKYALPEHLYILAAMNQADVSVEPLDVAFLRRWALIRLEPDAAVLRSEFHLSTVTQPLPEQPSSPEDVYNAAVRAWETINARIRVGRGPEFQLGHGIFFTGDAGKAKTVEEALTEMAQVWGYIRQHIDEVFFGDLQGISETLNVYDGPANHPYKLEQIMFAGEPRQELVGPVTVGPNKIYALLRAVAERR